MSSVSGPDSDPGNNPESPDIQIPWVCAACGYANSSVTLNCVAPRSSGWLCLSRRWVCYTCNRDNDGDEVDCIECGAAWHTRRPLFPPPHVGELPFGQGVEKSLGKGKAESPDVRERFLADRAFAYDRRDLYVSDFDPTDTSGKGKGAQCLCFHDGPAGFTQCANCYDEEERFSRRSDQRGQAAKAEKAVKGGQGGVLSRLWGFVIGSPEASTLAQASKSAKGPFATQDPYRHGTAYAD